MTGRKILVAVDLQNDFIDGALGTKEAEAIIPAAAARIREMREAGADIFATLDTHGTDYAQTQEGKRLPVPHCIKGTEGWQLNPEIRDAVGDGLLVEKPTFGSVRLPELFTLPVSMSRASVGVLLIWLPPVVCTCTVAPLTPSL